MRCFVIMPFGDSRTDPDRAHKWDQIYTHWIKPAVESVEVPGSPERIICHRADKEMIPGDALVHIVEQLVDSEIVVADLTEQSPNVFYELGVRHAVNNNTILIADDRNNLPFDVKGLRTIIYRYDPEGMLKLRDSLQSMIRNILADGNRIDNPVRKFLYDREIERLVSAPSPPGFDAVNELISAFAAVRKELAEQKSGLRTILEALTSRNGSGEAEGGEWAYEGVWRCSDESTYCFKRVRGEIRIPYCYGESKGLTSHVFNCRLVGNTIVGRFRWFESNIEGTMYLRLVSIDKMDGGWWYGHLPIEGMPLPDQLARMTPIQLWKVGHQLPEWASKYFADVEAGAVL